jgi:hypothetical protein
MRNSGMKLSVHSSSVGTSRTKRRNYYIEIDLPFLNVDIVAEDTYELDEINQHSSDIECLLAQQHTLLWNEDKYLEISPGRNNKPLSIIHDEHAEELSFPSIYLGQARTCKTNVRVTPFMMVTSEIRQKDRRGVTPQHITYIAMKILRLRFSEGFKLQGETGVTDPLEELNSIRWSQLINEDPVTYMMYFNKPVVVIMRVLQHRKISPFGEHRLVYYLKRIEFQHRGSHHAHLLIWMENDPLEEYLKI